MKSVTAWQADLQDVTLDGLKSADVRRRPSERRPLALVILITTGSLFMQSLGYALGWTGHEGPALALFFVGIVGIFLVSAWRLLGERASRRERLVVSTILVVALTTSVFLVSPLLFDGFDDLLHQASLWNWGAHRGALAHNSLLPVSPDYPGLEGLTLGIRWLTGLPLVICEMTTIFLSRIILMLAIFFVVERLTGSSRAGGVGVVVYAVSPQFYGFNAAFAYQTLALGLGAGCVYLLLLAVDRRAEPSASARSSRRLLWLSAACCLATVVTHHLVGWLTVGLLVVWAVGLALLHKRAQFRAVGTVALVGLVGAGVWTAVNSRTLFHYLHPIFSITVNGFLGIFQGDRRHLFKSSGSYVTPPWEQVAILGAAVAIVVLLAVSIRAVLSGRTHLRGGRLRWIPITVALGYFLVLLSRLASGSQEAGGRLSTFSFFGIAIVFGAWYVVASRRLWKPAVLGVTALCAVGFLILGSGPDWLLVPGPYMAPASGHRSIDNASVAASRWAAANLPANSIVAADRDNAGLMAAVGHLSPESEGSGGINVGPLYFAQKWGPRDTALVRHAHIRYLVVDQRLLSGPPTYGFYFEPGETTGRERLTRTELGKFSSIRGMQRIYDNGPIQIYDLAGMLGLSPAQARGGAPQGWPYGPNWGLFAAAAVVVVIWARRWRSRSGEDLLVRLIGVTLVIMGCALVIFFVPLPATWIGFALLALLAVLGLIAPGRPPARRRGGHTGNGNGHSTPVRSTRVVGRFAPAAVGLVAVLFGGGAVAVAVASEAIAWRPPTSLAVHEGRLGSRVVDVHVANESSPAYLALLDGRSILHAWQVPAGHASWSVAMPRAEGGSGTAARTRELVILVQDERIVRSVTV